MRRRRVDELAVRIQFPTSARCGGALLVLIFRARGRASPDGVGGQLRCSFSELDKSAKRAGKSHVLDRPHVHVAGLSVCCPVTAGRSRGNDLRQREGRCASPQDERPSHTGTLSRLERGDRPAAPSLQTAGDYLGCAPICFMSVSESKYWRLDLILFPSKV